MTTALHAAPIVDGLFTVGPEATLLASACPECKHVFFPRRRFCRNPACGRAALRETVLSRQGKLFSLTVQHYLPPAPFRLDPGLLPFGVALVEFPEGIRVMGMIHETVDQSTLRIGAPMEVTTGFLYREGDVERVTWKFRLGGVGR